VVALLGRNGADKSTTLKSLMGVVTARSGSIVLNGRDLADTGQTIVVVEQNLAAALSLAERAYIVNNGHIAHEGPTSEIKARPQMLERYLGV
jgi:ABC-type branched-subunit amino acid transport system ATPase component